jgi:hypothetical protein
MLELFSEEEALTSAQIDEDDSHVESGSALLYWFTAPAWDRAAIVGARVQKGKRVAWPSGRFLHLLGATVVGWGQRLARWAGEHVVKII